MKKKDGIIIYRSEKKGLAPSASKIKIKMSNLAVCKIFGIDEPTDGSMSFDYT